MKLSEVSPHTSAAISTILPKYLPSPLIQFVNGAVAETTVLLKERFDHIMYTGNATVAKIIMKAASEHLTPVTLELGGKSPVYVHHDTDIKSTVKRILWAKLTNAGQVRI